VAGTAFLLTACAPVPSQPYEFTDLGTLGGGHTVAEAINDLGVGVGFSTNEEGITRAFIWSATEGMVALDIPLEPEEVSYAHEINNVGQIVGSFGRRSGCGQHAFFWDSGQIIDLGLLCILPLLEFRRAINNFGVIVGTSRIRIWDRLFSVLHKGSEIVPPSCRGAPLQGRRINDHRDP
jgi:probable HAF family extracellular repeat protein